MIFGKYVETEVGRLLLTADEDCIVGLKSGQIFSEIEEGTSPLLERAAAEITEYFSGERREFTVPVKTGGTPFQEKVWKALRQIPFGETRSYGQIAEAVGSPRGARAVGMACNRNPILLLIPCHRVVGSTGKLVGFGGGLPMKERLLALEKQAAIKD